MIGEQEREICREREISSHQIAEVINAIPEFDVEEYLRQPCTLNETQLAKIDELLGDRFIERVTVEAERRINTPTPTAAQPRPKQQRNKGKSQKTA